jgi:peroxiredoxin Q/BCP
MISQTLKLHDPVPLFQTHDSSGNQISSQSLLGQPYVLYFYPKDHTPGCTAQACELRDAKPQFDLLNTLLIGVSPDSAASHDQFISKYALNFLLIPDIHHELCELFQVWEKQSYFAWLKKGVTRSTFIVDAKGNLCWIEKPVKVEGHAQRVLAVLKNIQAL